MRLPAFDLRLAAPDDGLNDFFIVQPAFFAETGR
jgi:hypothetical protein